jgi:outer membrane protein assembly factor BamB
MRHLKQNPMRLAPLYFLLFILRLTAADWTGFRGPNGDSLTQAANLPLHWSERHNLAWKIALPGFGQSTPVTSEGKFAYLTAIEGTKKEKLVVLAIDLQSGKEAWRKTFASSRPQEAGDRTARAAPTPALDGGSLYVMFDSGDLLALSIQDGSLLWRKNFNEQFGAIQNGHDFGSSVRQIGSNLYVFVNHVGPSYLVALAKRDGALRWRVDFGPEGGWNTPVPARVASQDLLLIQRSGGVAAYDAETGKLLWEEIRTFSRENAIPSLTVSAKQGIAVVPSQAKGGSWAFPLTEPKRVLWTAKSATNAFSSPLLTAKRAYFVNSVGALFAVDLATGKDLWTTRLPATTWASAIGAGDRVYFFTGDGGSFVFRDSDQMEKLGEGRLEADSLVYAVTPLDDGFPHSHRQANVAGRQQGREGSESSIACRDIFHSAAPARARSRARTCWFQSR